jgi:hypothetical protein
MFKPALGWRKRKIAMMHITKTWFEDGKMVTETIPTEDVYKKEWEGLSVFEINDLVTATEHGLHDLVERTEAKLREKNSL